MRKRSRAAALALALALAASAGCSGTDVGYPRYILVEGTGGSDMAEGSSGTSQAGGSAGTPTDGAGGASLSVGGALTSGGAGGDGSTTGGSPQRGSGGAAGMARTAGSSMGGARAGTGGSPSMSGGVATSGDAGGAANAGSGNGPPGGAGASSTTSAFKWPDAYDTTAAPTPADGHHNAGTSCVSSSCHGSNVPFVFGGTVYQSDGKTAAPHVEVGISDGKVTLTAYSGDNGNIWLLSGASAIDWPNAVIALRNASGEIQKPASAPRAASCNGSGCHNSTNRLTGP